MAPQSASPKQQQYIETLVARSRAIPMGRFPRRLYDGPMADLTATQASHWIDELVEMEHHYGTIHPGEPTAALPYLSIDDEG